MIPRQVIRRVRVLATVAFVLAASVAVGVRVDNDGGWPLFVPAVAAGAVLVWPVRSVVRLAIVATSACLVLGLMTVGIFFGFSLAPLILALAAFRPSTDRATA